jgi:G3E family GTPase
MRVLVTGLPGSGKTRLIQAAPALPVTWLEANQPQLPERIDTSDRIWCVVDARALPPVDGSAAQRWLTQDLAVADAVVMSFADQADLMRQGQWQAWLKQQGVEACPRYWWLTQAGLEMERLQTWSNLESARATESARRDWQNWRQSLAEDWQVLEWRLSELTGKTAPKPMLEGLLAGLDAAQSNLGMGLLRVRGEMMTFEYDNRVAVEGHYQGVASFAAEVTTATDWIRLEGIGLDSDWLKALVTGSVV